MASRSSVIFKKSFLLNIYKYIAYFFLLVKLLVHYEYTCRIYFGIKKALSLNKSFSNPKYLQRIRKAIVLFTKNQQSTDSNN